MLDGHGDDIHHLPHPVRANFSSNVYPHADLSGLQAHLCSRMQVIGHYPEPHPSALESRIATARGVPAEAVIVTPGATAAIYLIAQTFGGTRTAVLQPAFSEYADACQRFGHRLSALHQWPGHLPADVRMLWLCTPSNPTGTVPPKDALLELIDRHPQVCFVVDLSYEAFTFCPLLSPAEAVLRPNVLLIHSLTKRFAIPGLRLGYLVGSPGLVSRIRAYLMPWAVHALAVEAGMYLLRGVTAVAPGTPAPTSGLNAVEQGARVASRPGPAPAVRLGEVSAEAPDPFHLPPAALSAYLSETQRLRQSLQQLGGLDVWPTDAHFFVCRLRVGHAAALRRYLLMKHGLLIRDASNFAGLDARFIRLSTQSPADNDALVCAINRFLALP